MRRLIATSVVLAEPVKRERILRATRAIGLAALLATAAGLPTAASHTNEEWCSGLVDYLDSETALQVSGAVADAMHQGCLGYLSIGPEVPATAAGHTDPPPEEESPAGTFGPELAAKRDLAFTLWGQGDLAGARDLMEQVVEASTLTLGPEHPDTLLAMNNLANALLGQGEIAGARDLLEQVLDVRTRTLGPEHPRTLTTKGGLALTLWGEGDPTGARDLSEEVLEAFTRTLGPEHPSTLSAKDDLAMMLAALDEASP